MPCVGSVISLPKVLEKLPQPLPWEIVTADMSHCGNEGARGFVGVAGGKRRTQGIGRTRAVGRMRDEGCMVFSKLWASGGVVCNGAHGPLTMCYDPALPRQPAIPFSAILHGAIVRSWGIPYALPNWHWVFSTLHYTYIFCLLLDFHNRRVGGRVPLSWPEFFPFTDLRLILLR